MNYLATFFRGNKPNWAYRLPLVRYSSRLEALHAPFDADLGGPDVRGAPSSTTQNYVQLTVSFIISTNPKATAVQGYQQSVPQTHQVNSTVGPCTSFCFSDTRNRQDPASGKMTSVRLRRALTGIRRCLSQPLARGARQCVLRLPTVPNQPPRTRHGIGIVPKKFSHRELLAISTWQARLHNWAFCQFFFSFEMPTQISLALLQIQHNTRLAVHLGVHRLRKDTLFTGRSSHTVQNTKPPLKPSLISRHQTCRYYNYIAKSTMTCSSGASGERQLVLVCLMVVSLLHPDTSKSPLWISKALWYDSFLPSFLDWY
jgi:hypothetical protein